MKLLLVSSLILVFGLRKFFFIKGEVNSKLWIYLNIDTKPLLPIEDWLMAFSPISILMALSLINS